VYGLVGRAADGGERGAAVGTTASLAGAGLLLGPALLGQVAAGLGLRSSIAVFSVLCGAMALLALRIPVVPKELP
jgi:MFS family permease